MTRRLCLGLLLLVAMTLLYAGPVLAQSDDLPIPAAPQALQAVLAGLAKSVGVGFVIAFLFKRPGWFVGLADNAKWWVIFGLSLGLPVLAQALIDLVPAHIWVLLDPYWHALSWGFIAWAGSQVAFEALIKPGRVVEEAGY